MNRALGIAFLIAGVALLVYGFRGSESITSELSEAITGAPTNKTLWLMIGGVVCSVVGAMSLFGRHEGNF